MSRLPSLSTAAWCVSIALWLMFCGMMHDFRSVGFTQEMIDKELIERRDDLAADVNTALIERKLAFVLAAAIAAFCWISPGRNYRWHSPTGAVLIACGLSWMMASYFWSDSRPETAKELLRVGVYSALCFGLVRRFPPLELVFLLIVASLLSIAVAVFCEVYVGSSDFVDEVYRLNGSMHPNSLSRFAVYTAIPAAAFALFTNQYRLFWITLLLGSFVIIQLTACRTSLGSAVVGIVALAALHLGWKRFVMTSAVGTAFLGLLLLVIGVGGQSMARSAGDTVAMGRSESVSSLTGRLPLWNALLERAEQHPLVGYGYGAFWNSEKIASIHRQIGWYAGHSHNCYVELLVNIGAIGLLLFLAIGVFAFYRCVLLTNQTGEIVYPILGGLLAASFMNGLTEVGCVLPREHAIFSGLFLLATMRSPVNEFSIAPQTGPAESFE